MAAQENGGAASIEMNVRHNDQKMAVSIQVTSLQKLSIAMEDGNISFEEYSGIDIDNGPNLNHICCVTHLWAESVPFRWPRIFKQLLPFGIWETKII